ncbi:hypothetical protein [Acetobacter malorum]|nr:hypothetical protein [Acetobacter malorum]
MKRMTTEQFVRLGQALFGKAWKAEMARNLDVSLRHVQRMADGSSIITNDVRDNCFRVTESRLREVRSVVIEVFGKSCGDEE